jgi:NADH:ubiquinone oxidoreductase subunit 4 (subunit M)
MFQRIFTGDLSDFLRGLGNHLTDISPIEMLTVVPLATLIVVFGLFPGLLLQMIQGTVGTVLGELNNVSAIHIFFWQ